jgi:hypothetical protein
MENMEGAKEEGGSGAILPIEVEERVLHLVSVRSLGTCSLVCRTWHSIISSSRFLPAFFAIHFGGGGHRMLLKMKKKKKKNNNKKNNSKNNNSKFDGDWKAMTIKSWKEWRKIKERQRSSAIGRLGWALSAGHEVLVAKLVAKHSISLDTLDGYCSIQLFISELFPTFQLILGLANTFYKYLA